MSWIKVRLDEIVESNVIGLVKGTKDQSSDYTYEYVKMNNITSDGKLDLRSYTRVNANDLEVQKYSLEYGDLLFNTRNSAELVGKSCIYNRPESVLFNNNIMRIRFNKGVDSAFIQYQLYSTPVRSQIKGLVNSTTNVAAIYYKNLKNLELILPPLPVQERIAAILDAADALRQKDQALLKKYDDLTQSLFLDMFGDPVSNPKGWEREKLENLCAKITDGTHHSPEPKTSGFPYVTAKHVKPFSLRFDAKPTFISESDHYEIYKRCNPEYGDVLYIKDGATTGIACINTFNEEVSMLSSLALLKLESSVLNNWFLVYWLNHEGIKANLISEFMSGAAIQRYTLKKIKSFQVLTPPIDLQNAFAKKIEVIEKQKEQVQANIKKSEDLFQSLLQRAFKGELVSEDNLIPS